MNLPEDCHGDLHFLDRIKATCEGKKELEMALFVRHDISAALVRDCEDDLLEYGKDYSLESSSASN